MTSISNAFEYLGTEDWFIIDAQNALSGLSRNSVGWCILVSATEHKWFLGGKSKQPLCNDTFTVDGEK